MKLFCILGASLLAGCAGAPRYEIVLKVGWPAWADRAQFDRLEVRARTSAGVNERWYLPRHQVQNFVLPDIGFPASETDSLQVDVFAWSLAAESKEGPLLHGKRSVAAKELAGERVLFVKMKLHGGPGP